MRKGQRRLRNTRNVTFVFCEGKTEKEYIKVMRAHFRVPMKIITKVIGTSISPSLIANHLKNEGYAPDDKVFFIYDGDRSDILHKLQTIKSGDVLLSVPCFELWFLLHFTTVSREYSSTDIVKIFIKYHPQYVKGLISAGLKQVLINDWQVAASRAKSLPVLANPSSNVYKFIEYLDQLKI